MNLTIIFLTTVVSSVIASCATLLSIHNIWEQCRASEDLEKAMTEVAEPDNRLNNNDETQ